MISLDGLRLSGRIAKLAAAGVVLHDIAKRCFYSPTAYAFFMNWQSFSSKSSGFSIHGVLHGVAQNQKQNQVKGCQLADLPSSGQTQDDEQKT